MDYIYLQIAKLVTALIIALLIYKHDKTIAHILINAIFDI